MPVHASRGTDVERVDRRGTTRPALALPPTVVREASGC
jgi:hypothetical protein